MIDAQPSEGFFWCEHCSHVINLDPDADAVQTYKCPRCHKWTVKWRFPVQEKPRRQRPAPVSRETATVLFAQLRASLEGTT